MRPLFSTIAWIAAGAVAVAALYWTLVNTPDSNALMLSGSLLLIFAIVVVGAVTIGGAIRLMQQGAWSRGVPRAGLTALPWFVVALVPVIAVIWLAGRADAWVIAKSGEISAWFIARFGWADVAWLLTGVHVLLAWSQWVAAPWLGLTLIATALDGTGAASLPRRWLTRACRWRSLALATIWFLLFVAMPWRLALWRPTTLPATWIEPALAGLRLLVVAILMTTGAALIVRAAVGRAAAR